ncbi:MAG: hypothetical protein WC346_03630 [Methanogenium sp.]
MLIQLYHGTNNNNAKRILKEGFKDRIESKEKNWKDEIASQPGFVYLTRAYPFFYAMNAANSEDEATVLLVEVDSDDLYPDEDFLREVRIKDKDKKIDIREFKEYGSLSLEKLGNVAIQPSKIKRVIGSKSFKTSDMIWYSDPAMSIYNYMFLGNYYRELTDTWWKGGDWKKINQTESLLKSMKRSKKS